MLGKYVAGASPTAVVGGFGIGDTNSTTVALLTGTNGTISPIASTAAGNMPRSRGLAPASATTLTHSFLVSGAMADGLPTFRQRTTGPDTTNRPHREPLQLTLRRNQIQQQPLLLRELQELLSQFQAPSLLQQLHLFMELLTVLDLQLQSLYLDLESLSPELAGAQLLQQ